MTFGNAFIIVALCGVWQLLFFLAVILTSTGYENMQAAMPVPIIAPRKPRFKLAGSIFMTAMRRWLTASTTDVTRSSKMQPSVCISS